MEELELLISFVLTGSSATKQFFLLHNFHQFLGYVSSPLSIKVVSVFVGRTVQFFLIRLESLESFENVTN